MITLADLEDAAGRAALAVLGAFHPAAGDGAPEGAGTLILFGPREPGFWTTFTAAPEWQDGKSDPLDRWSKRVIGTVAEGFGGRAIFPSDGPPYPPFYRWALLSGRSFASPVTLLVHDRAGLMVSFRGAVALSGRIDLPAPKAGSPCESCDGKPCLGACPAGALTGKVYDVAACHGFLDSDGGGDCLSAGCRVRRACPISQAYGRLPEQSAYHMRIFHR